MKEAPESYPPMLLQRPDLMRSLWGLLIRASGGNSETERARLIATALPSLLPCDLGGIALFDEETRNWEPVFQSNNQVLRGEDAGQILPAIEACLLAALATPSLVILPPRASPGELAVPEALLQAGIGRISLAPMTTGNHRLGVVVIARSGTDDFSPEEQLFISSLAEHAAMAFENLRLQKARAEFSSQLQTRHELILDAAAEGIYGLDRQGHVTFSNRAAIEILGWQDKDIFGRPLHEVHHHSRADGSPYPMEECPINAAIRDGEIHRVDSEVFWKSDGSSVCVEYISSPILRDGKPDGAVVVFQDISRRKEIEAQREKAYEEIKLLKEQLEQQRDYLRDEINITVNFGDIIGESKALQRTLAQVEAVAATTANVLVLGESGVGKEMVARAIHLHSDRRDKPLIKVNCASIPKELFESEFFGHVRGAFTGAHKDRVGRLQLADGGTIFLDEVGEIPLDLQGKLLRALQEHEFERVGDDKTIRANVRVVAATNRNLSAETEAGRFRQDLYYRLSVFPIEVPPLRQRTDDIIPLAKHFLQCVCKELGRDRPKISTQHAKRLMAHSWPGNIRELKNVIERAVILSHGDRLRLDLAMPDGQPEERTEESADLLLPEAPEFLTEAEFREAERKNITAALRHADWRVWGPSGAAALLGVKPTTLAYRMKVLGVKTEK